MESKLNYILINWNSIQFKLHPMSFNIIIRMESTHFFMIIITKIA
jgi:hypothetical protein